MVEKKVTRAKRLYCLVLDYLGVVSRHLPGPCPLDTGTEEEQVMMAARNCLYLPALSSVIEKEGYRAARHAALPGDQADEAGASDCS